MPVIVSGEWKIHVSNLVQIHQKIHDFASNPPFPHLALGVHFSIWNHASIFFWEMKNICAKFGLDLSENAWFCIKPTLLPFGPQGWLFDMKSCQYLFPGDEKYMCWTVSSWCLMLLLEKWEHIINNNQQWENCIALRIHTI